MSNAEDRLARQRRRAAAYSLASDLLANGDPPPLVEGRLVSEGLSTEEAHEIVGALQVASQRAENVMRGGMKMGVRVNTPITLTDSGHRRWQHSSNANDVAMSTRVTESRSNAKGRRVVPRGAARLRVALAVASASIFSL